MPDLLVNLLKLPPLEPGLNEMRRRAIIIRRAEPFEITRVRAFVEQNFTSRWADEILVGFARQPVSVFIAICEQELVGFAAYECTRRAFFGPTGVIEKMRGNGIGKALLLSSLWGLRELAYVYAIIGGAGPVEFYEKIAGAILIPGSEPGIYVDLLK
jgi:GNAT superfamily N-acetyltransferase